MEGKNIGILIWIQSKASKINLRKMPLIHQSASTLSMQIANESHA